MSNEMVEAARKVLQEELRSKRTKERHKRVREAAEAYFAAVDAAGSKGGWWKRFKRALRLAG